MAPTAPAPQATQAILNARFILLYCDQSEHPSQKSSRLRRKPTLPPASEEIFWKCCRYLTYFPVPPYM
jgi:hypothetical protein